MNKYAFEKVDGTDAPWLEEAMPGILALFAVMPDQAIYVGTGFMVDPKDRFVTARHVAAGLRDYYEETYREAQCAALVIAPRNGGLVPIRALEFSPDDNITSDLATGHLDITDRQLSLPFFKLSQEPVEVGEDVTAIGHAFMPDEVIHLADGVFTVDEVQLQAVSAPVVEIKEKRANLPAPTFMLNALMPGGMSGGPIVRDVTGEITGVCAYGLMSDQHEPYCYGSMLGPLWQPFGFDDEASATGQ